MKKVVLIVLILLLVLGVAWCVIDESDFGKSPDPFFESVFVGEFSFDNSQYIMVDEEIDTSSFTTLVGYYINAEDLEKWKSIDNDDNLIYAIDDDNLLYKYAYHENDPLKNRFELFSSEEFEDYLALHQYGDRFAIFKKVQNDNNAE